MPRPALPNDDLYVRLGVPTDASVEAIEVAWRAPPPATSPGRGRTRGPRPREADQCRPRLAIGPITPRAVRPGARVPPRRRTARRRPPGLARAWDRVDRTLPGPARPTPGPPDGHRPVPGARRRADTHRDRPTVACRATTDRLRGHDPPVPVPGPAGGARSDRCGGRGAAPTRGPRPGDPGRDRRLRDRARPRPIPGRAAERALPSRDPRTADPRAGRRRSASRATARTAGPSRRSCDDSPCWTKATSGPCPRPGRSAPVSSRRGRPACPPSRTKGCGLVRAAARDAADAVPTLARVRRSRGRGAPRGWVAHLVALRHAFDPRGFDDLTGPWRPWLVPADQRRKARRRSSDQAFLSADPADDVAVSSHRSIVVSRTL